MTSKERSEHIEKAVFYLNSKLPNLKDKEKLFIEVSDEYDLTVTFLKRILDYKSPKEIKDTKVCVDCKDRKFLDEFYYSRNDCKECVLKKQKSKNKFKLWNK